MVPSRSTSSLPTLPCACASLRRATRAVTQLYDARLREVGLRATQFTLLQTLQRAKRLTQGELGTLLALDSTTLSRTLAPLESRGWIRAHVGEDRRERHWTLTARGRQVYQEGLAAWEGAQKRLRAILGPRRWEQLLTLSTDVTLAAHHA